MIVSLSQLKAARSRKRKRVGRGSGSGRGTYSGRGMKGQRSRSGGTNKLKRRGLKQVLQQIPKSRGFKSMYSGFEPVNIEALEKKYETGATVTLKNLKINRLIEGIGSGVKILGQGALSKKLTVYAHGFSKSAEAAIIKAGGTVHVIAVRQAAPAEKKEKAGKRKKQ
ncbi:MAG: 50S ribosomal protein L15 [Patescibacteria group bacterium]